MNDFQTEWAILHNDIEKYERFSLVIKLFSLFLSALAFTIITNQLIVIFLILILWLQNGIWNTFKARLERRILIIERVIRDNTENNNTAFQLYTQWEDNRPGTVTLIKEYLVTSLRPTVAYPYAMLVLLTSIIYQFSN